MGKGLTFDSGGYNLKVQGGIETMKCDMVRRLTQTPAAGSDVSQQHGCAAWQAWAQATT